MSEVREIRTVLAPEFALRQPQVIALPFGRMRDTFTDVRCFGPFWVLSLVMAD